MGYCDNTKKLCIASLKYKLNKCERRNIEFTKSRKKSKQVNPHKAYSEEELQTIFDIAATKPEYNLKVHLLYDMAARI